MNKNKINRTGLVFAADTAVLAVYWAFLLFSMRGRIGASYGQYPLFASLSVLRAGAAPLLVLAIGAVFFFKNRLGGWRYPTVSVAAAAGMEMLGTALAMVFYRQSFRDTAAMLEPSFMLFMYVSVTLVVWAVLSAVRGVIRAVKKRNATDLFDVYDRARQTPDTPPAVSAHRYASGFLPFLGYLLRWFVLCVMLAFFAAGAVTVYLLDTKSPAIIFSAMGVGAALSAVIAFLRGVMQVEVGGGRVVVKRRKKVVGSYSFEDFRMSAERMVHLIEGVIPLNTDRYIVLADKSGYTNRIHCRCFSEATFVAMTDEILLIQRNLIRQTEKRQDAAIEEEAQRDGFSRQPPGDLSIADAVSGAKIRRTVTERMLPLPGDDHFVSLCFTVNKDRMISVERRRYNAITLGLLGCCAALYAAWYFFVYLPMADGMMPGIRVLTAALIFVWLFVLPVATMTVRFNWEKKRIPSSVLIENGRFTVDGQPFECEQVRLFKMTHPQGAKIGTTSHRMHIEFFYYGWRHVYTVGSGTVKSANFPDYPLLYAAFDAQRAYMAQPAEQRRPIPAGQDRRTNQTATQLTPFTVLTVTAPRP